jgi:hypothetical protein
VLCTIYSITCTIIPKVANPRRNSSSELTLDASGSVPPFALVGPEIEDCSSIRVSLESADADADQGCEGGLVWAKLSGSNDRILHAQDRHRFVKRGPIDPS